MKVIGQTPSGGTILELSPQETTLLNDLQRAIEGAKWIPGPPNHYPVEGNLDRAFLAIIHFVETKFAINSLRRLVEELDQTVTGKGDR